MLKSKNSLPNVYHVIFDGFNPLLFEKALNELGLRNDFGGFTFFEKNRANYLDTFVSLPSLMSGSLYKHGSYKNWMSPFNSYLLLKNMHQLGFTINGYLDYKPKLSHPIKLKDLIFVNNKYFNNLPKHYSVLNMIGKNIFKIPKSKIKQVLIQSLSRILSPVSKNISPGERFPPIPVAQIMLRKLSLTLPLFLEFLNDINELSTELQYNYIHVMLPHAPYYWNRSFQFQRVDYFEQLCCTVNLMKELIVKLKTIDQYDDSLIIFNSDHGWSDFKMDYPFMDQTPKEVLKKIEDITNHDVHRTLHRSHTLMLIKPPGVSDQSPLKFSNLCTQNLDIFATITDLVTHQPAKTNDENNAFSTNFNASKPVELFVGFHKYNRLGLKSEFGTHFFKGKIAHFSIENGIDWKIQPDMEIKFQ